MDGTSAFYSKSEEAIEREVLTSGQQTDQSQIDDVYEINHCVEWIKSAGYQRVKIKLFCLMAIYFVQMLTYLSIEN